MREATDLLWADLRRSGRLDHDQRSILRAHLQWALDLDPWDARLRLPGYVRQLDAAGYSADRTRYVAQTACSLLTLCGIRTTLAELPVPRRRRVEAPSLTAAEAARLVRSRLLPIHLALVPLALLLTGARPSEARAWRWSDLDRTGPVWVLRYSDQLHPKTRSRRPTKDRAPREIPLRAELRSALEASAETLHRGEPRPDAPLLPKLLRRGARAGALVHWDPAWFARAWREALEAHGIRPVSPKAARHTFISLALDSGADPLAVRALTHPASLPRAVGDRGAFGRYVHLSLEARIRAVEAIRLPLTELCSPAQLELFGGA